ncbi:MAG: sulfurtransferase TusA family protein [Myxococcales bacterium]|nr:sulfurtransferase TusA family protein [Myxococcales bacterium]
MVTPVVTPADPEILDLRGEVCPYTFVRTKLRLEELGPGARIAVLIDHESASRSVPKSVREWGQRVEEVRELVPGLFVIVIEKLTPAERPKLAAPALAFPPAPAALPTSPPSPVALPTSPPSPTAVAQSPAADRRLAPRASLDAHVRITRPAEAPAAPALLARAWNLSLVGAYLVLGDRDRYALIPGEPLDLTFTADGLDARAHATLLRLDPGNDSRPPGAAALFAELSPDELAALHVLIVHASRQKE